MKILANQERSAFFVAQRNLRLSRLQRFNAISAEKQIAKKTH